MSGTGRVYVTGARTVGYNQYDVDVRFDIAFDYGGYNANAVDYNIHCDGQKQIGSTTFNVASGGGSWVWTNIGGTKTFRVTMPTSGASKYISLYGIIWTGVNPDVIEASGSYTLAARTWQWTVSYNGNGSTTYPVSNVPSNQTKTQDTTLTLSTTKPTRTGHTFKRWNTNPNGSGTNYNPGDSYTANAALTLYAIWNINTYQIKYDANAGGDSSVKNMPSNETKTHDVSYTLSATTPTRTGYDFKCWNTQADGKGVDHYPKEPYKTNAALTLYAVWTKKTYTVSYNANADGDNTVTNMPSSQTKTHFSDLKLSTNVPTRQRYNFLGWATSANGVIAYQPGGTYKTEASVTLYAIWELAASKITYYDDDGKPHTGLCHIYDDKGNMHYAILTVYGSDGKPHVVI